MNAQRSIATLNLKLRPDQVDRLANACEQLHKNARKAQGWPETMISIANTIPQFRSWAWYRECARLSMEHDYSWRTELPGESLWKKSNRSDGVFEAQVEQHFAEIGKTMLRSHRFFSFVREGPEDEQSGADDQNLDLIKRRLKKRSKDTRLRSKMEDAVRAAMIGGECIVEPALIIGRRLKLRTEKIVLVNGNPLTGSQGQYFGSSSDKIIINDDGTKSPLNDQSIRLTPDVILEESPDTHQFWSSESFNNGSRFQIIDHRDFVCDPRWSDLDEADYRAVEFSWRMDQMVEYLSGGWNVDEEALRAYQSEYSGNGSSAQSAAKSSRKEMGEALDEGDVSTRNASLPETQDLIRFIREYVSVDVLGLNMLQELFVIRDPEKNRVIAYTFARDVIPWCNSDPKHPFIPVVSDRVTDRWYGRGYFQNMYDDFMSVDELKNQSRLEIACSGNAKFVKPWLIKNVASAQDGKGKIYIRGEDFNILDQAAMEASDAMTVIPIEPMVEHINEQYQFQLGMVRSKYSQIMPGSAEGTGIEGANTAFGMNLLDEKGNTHLSERQKSLSDGIDKVVEVFARIELLNTNEEDAKAQLGKENYEKLKAFISANSEDFTDALETLLSNANDATSATRSQNILTIIQQWRAWPVEFQEADRPAFRQLLLDLDARDPDALLSLNDEAIARYQQKLAEQQAAAGVSATGGQGIQGVPGQAPTAAQGAPAIEPSQPAIGAPRQPPSPKA